MLALLAIAGFAADRYTARWASHTGTVLRTATAAQRSIWEAESGTRRFGLRADSGAPARVRVEQDSAAALVGRLHALTGDNPPQHRRLDDLTAALARWDSTFVTPLLSGRQLTRALALDGTIAFDEVSRHLDAFIAVETALRTERLRAQQRVAWLGLTVVLVALGLFGAAAAHLTQALGAEAAHTLARQRQIEDQSTELEQQAVLLEKQAAQLEAQANELRERIVERDETNRLLRQTATFLDSALESAPFGIAFYDRGLRFQRINEALARINGAPAEAHLGRTIEEMIPALAPTIRPIMEQVLVTGIARADVVVEGETPAHAGERRRWLATYYPIARPGEPSGGVGCMVLDVTEQQRVEHQLRQAQKLEAVGRLAGGIAHDFNNVLTVIQSYAEVLAFEFEEDGRHSEEVNAIRGAADRATALARQLLAFSRRDVIIPRDVDVNAVILGLDLILRRLLRQDVQLKLELATAPLVVRMDAGQLEQVLMNLTINAVDAMATGGTLLIRTSAAPPAETGGPERAVLTVEDTGHGMSAEVQERLFEPFFTTKPAGQGTGLGLATTYAIVIEAGGTIGVTSSPGAGSRFDVMLPISPTPVAQLARRESPKHGTVAARGTEVVLIAEDETAIRTALSRVLHAHGYRVLEASNGGEALRIAGSESGPIHLLLTDVMMPGIGGKELVQRLLETRPKTRVILMSGYTDDAELRAALGAARFVFLQKPFAARQVVGAVRNALDAS
ncbi:MAG: ATP-binding protein [Gemmatimonadaceae bacterium]